MASGRTGAFLITEILTGKNFILKTILTLWVLAVPSLIIRRSVGVVQAAPLRWAWRSPVRAVVRECLSVWVTESSGGCGRLSYSVGRKRVGEYWIQKRLKSFLPPQPSLGSDSRVQSEEPNTWNPRGPGKGCASSAWIINQEAHAKFMAGIINGDGKRREYLQTEKKKSFSWWPFLHLFT